MPIGRRDKRSDPGETQSEDDCRWDAETLKGVSLKANEAKCVLYLGYSDLGQFRKYLCSAPFLQYFLLWAQHHTGSSFRSHSIFQLLNIAWKEDQLEEKYGETVEDLLGRYAKNENSDKINIQHILAGLIYQLVHHAQGYRWDFQDQITELFDMQFSDNSFSGLDDSPATSQWGPLPGEAWGEPYNRALNAFQMMTKNIIRWDERHGKSNGHALNQLDQALKLQFMKESSQTIFTAGVLLHESMIMLDKKIFKVYWRDSEKVREDLENRFDILSNTTTIAPDSRTMGEEE